MLLSICVYISVDIKQTDLPTDPDVGFNTVNATDAV